MMAEALGIQPAALTRWQRRRSCPQQGVTRPGRPEVIGAEDRKKIRACYLSHYGQWGPQVLSQWCRRQKMGCWSAATLEKAIADLKPPEPEPRVPLRYEVTASNVMWSEDGTGFGRGRSKRELLVVQDECSRKKVNYRLVGGPACSGDVVRYLEESFQAYGAPLVLKHDGDAIFHEKNVQDLLKRHGVVDLTSPAEYPRYNGKQERSMRDIKSYERAMRRSGVKGRLIDRLDAAIKDLNEDRPRPVLGGLTSDEAYAVRKKTLPDRMAFVEKVEQEERMLYARARSRTEKRSAHRRAVENVLLRDGLMVIEGCVSHD